MGPYTAFDAEKAYDDADKLRTIFRDDSLFDPDEHIDDAGNSNMEEALGDFCEELRRDHNCRAFIATDTTRFESVSASHVVETGSVGA